MLPFFIVTTKVLNSVALLEFYCKDGLVTKSWVSPLRLNYSETISHREKSEVGNETLDLGLQDIIMLFCYNLITFDSAAHLKWTNSTEKMALTHLWNETAPWFGSLFILGWPPVCKNAVDHHQAFFRHI